MASIKEMMGLDIQTIRALGIESGLNFHDGMKKSAMVKQLAAHAASGWMEVNQELMHDTHAEDMSSMLSDEAADIISDAARTAQMIAAAGYAGTFHDVMNHNSLHAVDAVNTYMDNLGVSAQDVWLHMPKPNPHVPVPDFKFMQAFLRDNLTDHQDFMPKLPGHYAGDFMAEYATDKGTVQDSYDYLAHIYLNKNGYSNHDEYQHDLGKVSRRLADRMGSQFLEVAYGAATGAKVGYHSILPEVGDERITSHIKSPREPLNAAGLPLGSLGSAVGDRSQYSLISSLTGQAENRGAAAAALREDIGNTLKSLSKSYGGGGDVGMNPYKLPDENDYSRLMDAASRYMDLSDARAAYSQLDEDVRPYSSYALGQMLQSKGEYMESEAKMSFDPAQPIRSIMGSTNDVKAGTDFTGDFSQPASYNAARSRREWKATADLDAAHANFRDVADGNRTSTVSYHDKLEQGSDAWFAMRNDYDITGSTVGGYLGNNPYTRPWKQMVQKLGFDAPKPNADMERGHRVEPIARRRVSEELGMQVSEVGAITNSMYPNMMYSPDGLIGDNALWEHKAPRKFFDLENDHPDYIDQVQLGMLLSNRNRTLFSQTVGTETRSQWIDRDEGWYDRNKDRLDSVVGRLEAGRNAITNGGTTGYDVEDKAARDIARKAMEGDGIWMDIKQRSTRGYSDFAGTKADPYLGSRRTYDENAIGKSDYSPNFVTTAGNQLINVAQPAQEAAGGGTALAIKQGILLANDELKQRGEQPGGGDGMTPRLTGPGQNEPFANMDFSQDNLNGGGGSGGKGGGGGRDRFNDGFDGFGDGFGRHLLNGLAGGSLRSLQGGFLNELKAAGPIGATIAGGIGAASIGGELINSIHDYSGVAQDYGSLNGVGFDAQQQSMEMLGLSKDQAQRANESVHSAFNRMANADPSAAVQMAVATRGLLTMSDIRESGGDPVKLAATFRRKALDRGWSQERIAGAAEMAGLSGFARVVNTDESIVSAAEGNDDIRSRFNSTELNARSRKDNAARAAISPDYFVQRELAGHYDGVLGGAANGMVVGYNGIMKSIGYMDDIGNASGAVDKFLSEHSFNLAKKIEQLESNGDRNATNPKSTAKSEMQVLDGTAANPGYGVRPAKDNSLEERARVGRDYVGALVGHYSGDERKAAAAYVAGPGAVDRSVELYGGDWMNHIRPEAQKRVKDLENLNAFTSAGAGTFRDVGSTGPSVGSINVNINAKINNREATATAQIQGGQSSTQTVNMGGAVSQRR